jgi:hypothetical protein
MRFRTYRIHKECSPINYSLELRQGCVVSFDTYEPYNQGTIDLETMGCMDRAAGRIASRDLGGAGFGALKRSKDVPTLR